MKPWLSIIGVGDDGLTAIGQDAKKLIGKAELFVGGERHLDMLGDDPRPRLQWASPLTETVTEVLDKRGQKICVLATGDPMHFGIGITFARHLPPEEMTVIPAPSAFSLAAARLGWNLSRTAMLTLHGRPSSLLIPHLQGGQKILAFSEDGTTAAAVADLLRRTGFGKSQMTVLEHMGGAKERIRICTADEFDLTGIQDLNTLAIHCQVEATTTGLPTTSSLADDAFVHDGQLTKREMRAITLTSLAPRKGELLWDIGAGSGSIAIEWMRHHPANRAIAFEKQTTRLAMIGKNKDALGVPNLQIVDGNAPDCLTGQDSPDAIFIGGGLTVKGLLAICHDSLKPGGRLVANGVTAESEQILFQAYQRWGGDLSRVDISRAHKIGGFTGWAPFRQITHYTLVKT